MEEATTKERLLLGIGRAPLQCRNRNASVDDSRNTSVARPPNRAHTLVRIPLAIPCWCIVVVFAFCLVFYSVELAEAIVAGSDESVTVTETTVYTGLSVLGIAAFASMAMGILRGNKRIATFGFALFVLGVVIQIAMIAFP